jgi:hypothetical protein
VYIGQGSRTDSTAFAITASWATATGSKDWLSAVNF